MSCEHCTSGKPIFATGGYMPRPETSFGQPAIQVENNSIGFIRGGERTDFSAKFCPECGEPLTDPQPLSLEQLKQMDGQPIWVMDIQHTSNREIFACVVVIDPPSESYCIHPMNFGGRSFPFRGYNKRWLAYPINPDRRTRKMKMYCELCGAETNSSALGWICPKCKAFRDMKGVTHRHVDTPFMPPQTNADYIRSMTDEELASLLSSAWHAADYEVDDYDPAVLKWLRQIKEDTP